MMNNTEDDSLFRFITLFLPCRRLCHRRLFAVSSSLPLTFNAESVTDAVTVAVAAAASLLFGAFKTPEFSFATSAFREGPAGGHSLKTAAVMPCDRRP